MAEIKFYQDAAKTIQVYPEIDPDGKFPGVTVGLADNLVSPDGVNDSANFVFRSTGGDQDISDGYASLKRLIGNATTTTVEESLTTNLIATGITSVSATTSTFRTAVSSTSGTYNFIYTPTISYTSDLVYSLDENIFGSVMGMTTGTYTFTYNASVSTLDESEIITSFAQNTFIDKVNQTPGTYVFEYDGTNWILEEESVTLSQYGIVTNGTETSGSTFSINYTNNYWSISGATVSMSNYGITTTGTERIGDTIEIDYESNDWKLNNTTITLGNYGITINAGTPTLADTIQIIYVAEQIGTIVVTHPSGLFSIGLNQFNYEGNYVESCPPKYFKEKKLFKMS